jgi:hypothetical protein
MPGVNVNAFFPIFAPVLCKLSRVKTGMVYQERWRENALRSLGNPSIISTLRISTFKFSGRCRIVPLARRTDRLKKI